MLFSCFLPLAASLACQQCTTTIPSLKGDVTFLIDELMIDAVLILDFRDLEVLSSWILRFS